MEVETKVELFSFCINLKIFHLHGFQFLKFDGGRTYPWTPVEGGAFSSIESFRFEDKNEYKYEIWRKKDTPESFILLFFTKTVSMVI